MSGAVDASHPAWPREFVSEVFHSLSQPVTALQCSLELSLLRDQTAEQYRASVEAALQNAERLRQRLLQAREMAEACDPGDTSQPVALDSLLNEVCEDLQPLFESAGQRLAWDCRAVQVHGDRQKLQRGFVYLLEYVQRNPVFDRGVTISTTIADSQHSVRVNLAGVSLTEGKISGWRGG